MKEKYIFAVSSKNCPYCDKFKETMYHFISYLHREDYAILDCVDTQSKFLAKSILGVKTIPSIIKVNQDTKNFVIFDNISDLNITELKTLIMS